MDRKKMEIIITTALGIVFVFVSINVFSVIKNARFKRPLTAKAGAKALAAVSAQELPIDKLTRIGSKADSIEWRRNPFIRGRGLGLSGAGTLNLTGIMWDRNNPQAIIGDEVVKEGDVIGKYKIIKINEDSVVISSDEGQKILNIWEE